MRNIVAILLWRPRGKIILDDIKLIEDALEQQSNPEPFGYFRALPFGWEDCAETDDGAIPLYEHPAIMIAGKDMQ